MNEAAVSARIIDALAQVASNEARGPAPLVSVAIEYVSANGGAPIIDVKTERRTKTLIFLSAEASTSSGERVASATSVHKIG